MGAASSALGGCWPDPPQESEPTTKDWTPPSAGKSCHMGSLHPGPHAPAHGQLWTFPNPASAGTRAEQASLGPSRLASVPHCSLESGTLHLTGGGENPRSLLVRASGDRIEAWGLPTSLNHSSPLETLGVPAALGQVLQARPQDEVSGPWSGGPGRVAGWGHYESRVCQGPLGPA